MKLRLLSCSILCVFISVAAMAQLRDVPSEVTAAFAKQYPGAESISYKDNLKNFHVHFALKGEKTIAKYNRKGEWKESEKTSELGKLPQPVQDGFQKSKYATDWKTSDVTVFYQPNNVERYRVRVEKGDVQRRYLFFNKNGRLIKDSITL